MYFHSMGTPALKSGATELAEELAYGANGDGDVTAKCMANVGRAQHKEGYWSVIIEKDWSP